MMTSSIDAESSAGKSREFLFTDKHFQSIRTFVTENTGIVLTDIKKDMVYGRLSKYIRKNFGGSFDRFCTSLEEEDEACGDFLINAITTNLTSFFRENHHFEYLASNIIPEICERNRSHKRIRIWSAGCSTGEEPYSIAMTFRDAMPDIADWDIRILATDLDANVVKHASEGVYSMERLTRRETEKMVYQRQGLKQRPCHGKETGEGNDHL